MLFCTGLSEVLTEEMASEQTPEGRKREKSFRNLGKQVPGREICKGLVKGIHGMFEEQEGGRCGWGHRSKGESGERSHQESS